MQVLEYSGLVPLLALALPVLALVTMMLIAVRQVARRRRADHQLTGRYGEPLLRKSEPAQPPAPPSAPQTPPSAPQAPPPPPPPAAAPVQKPDADTLATRIAKAEARSADADLPPLYLDMARIQISRRQTKDGAELLRKCIRIAAKLGQKSVHAGARLELGDLVREEGDLTTACEHWQIARGLFYELKQENELAGTEQRMRQHGCPTDWVLNDF